MRYTAHICIQKTTCVYSIFIYTNTMIKAIKLLTFHLNCNISLISNW